MNGFKKNVQSRNVNQTIADAVLKCKDVQRSKSGNRGPVVAVIINNYQ